MSAARIDSMLREEGFHYTAADLQDRLSIALRETDEDRITIKIPGAYEMSWSRKTVEAALDEIDPFTGL